MSTNNYKNRARIIAACLVILLISTSIALSWLNYHYSWQADWSFATRNTISQASQDLLQELSQPLHIAAYFDSNARSREQVRKFIARYQRFKPDTHLEFIDPQLDTETLQEQGFTRLGQVKVSYQDKHRIIAQLNEQILTSTLFALVRKDDPWVVVLQGHRERDPLDPGAAGLQKFAAELKKVGIHVQPLNLLEHQFIPDNTKVLMLAGPRDVYLPGELDLVIDYIQHGGNLLWLHEPAKDDSLRRLSDLFGVEQIPGVIIDANIQLRTVLGIKHPAVVPVVKYPQHNLTQGIKSHSLFPFASGFKVTGSETWESRVFLQSLERSWAELDDLSKSELAYEEDRGDTQGPINLGLTLRRNTSIGEQRVAIVGDSDFLANGYLGNGANLTLGVNLVNWLIEDERLMSIIPRSAPDQTIEFNDRDILIIAVLLLLVIPLTLAGIGVLIWWRRNRA